MHYIVTGYVYTALMQYNTYMPLLTFNEMTKIPKQSSCDSTDLRRLVTLLRVKDSREMHESEKETGR